MPIRTSTVAVVVAFSVNVFPEVVPAASRLPVELMATTTTGFITDVGRGTTAEPLEESGDDPYGEITCATFVVGMEGSRLTLTLLLVGGALEGGFDAFPPPPPHPVIPVATNKPTAKNKQRLFMFSPSNCKLPIYMPKAAPAKQAPPRSTSGSGTLHLPVVTVNEESDALQIAAKRVPKITIE